MTIAVETQGSAGAKPLPPETIAAATAVIFAVDVGVRDRGRFAGKPVVSSGVKRPIDEGDAMIAEALRYADDPNAPRVEGTAPPATGSGGGAGESWGARIRRVLMTGVSYMIPFVAAGGLLIALGFLFGGYEIALSNAYGDIAAKNTLLEPARTPTHCGLHHVLVRHGLLRLRAPRLPRRAVLRHRQDRVRALRPGAAPATSPTRSPTVPASPPASSWVAWPPTCST